jgi:hypothetical protein
MTAVEKVYDTDRGCPCPHGLLYSQVHQERAVKPVLPTGDGEIPRWLKGECSSMCSGEKSAEHKISPRLHRRFLIGIGGFLLPGFLVCQTTQTP